MKRKTYSVRLDEETAQLLESVLRSKSWKAQTLLEAATKLYLISASFEADEARSSSSPILEYEKKVWTKSQSQEPRPSLDFEKIYKAYPRKIGRSEGFKIFVSTVLTRKDLLDLESAVSRLNDHHMKMKTEMRYIPAFSTFMKEWKDWAHEDAGKCEDFSGKEDMSPEGLAAYLMSLEHGSK